MENNFHQDFIETHYEVADANHGMYSTEHFKTKADALEYILKHYKEELRDNNFWGNRKQIVIEKITIQRIVSEPI